MYELADFGKSVLINWEGIFPKVVRLEKNIQNSIDEVLWGRNFKSTSYFVLRTSEF